MSCWIETIPVSDGTWCGYVNLGQTSRLAIFKSNDAKKYTVNAVTPVESNRSGKGVWGIDPPITVCESMEDCNTVIRMILEKSANARLITAADINAMKEKIVRERKTKEQLAIEKASNEKYQEDIDEIRRMSKELQSVFAMDGMGPTDGIEVGG